MKITFITILILLCISCSVTPKNHEEINAQIRAYEDELKTLVSLELAMKDYSKGETSLETCEYRIDDFMYIRRQNKKKGLLIGLALSQKPIEEEYRKAEKYLLDEIHAWGKKRKNN